MSVRTEGRGLVKVCARCGHCAGGALPCSHCGRHDAFLGGYVGSASFCHTWAGDSPSCYEEELRAANEEWLREHG